MLNIIKLKLKNKYKNIAINAKNRVIHYKEFSPAVRNWKNSIYAYNKNTLSLIPEASKFTINLIKGYFNLYNLKLEKKNKSKKFFRTRLRKISTHKIFISNGEFKHTNDLVNITIYFYNRQLSNYLYKISKRYNKLLKKNIFKLKLLLIKKRGLKYIRENKKQKSIIFKALKYNNLEQKMFYEKIIKKHEIKYYKQFIKKSLRRVLLFIYFKQLIYINKSKFNNSYLQNLTSLIKKIYKKNIQFNFINVKYFYINSDIFTQSLVLKLRKNRRKLLRYLKSCILKTNVKNKINPISKYNLNLNNLNYLNLNNNDLDTTNELLYNLLLQNKIKSKYLKKIVFDNIRYKKISGIRIQAAGRLTKRYTASRSISKLRYKGNLINISSSLKGRPSALLRGKFRPNLQFTKLNSKTRIGSFGIKGWISGT